MTIRQALTRVIKAESNWWMNEFVYPAFAVPQALLGGSLDEATIAAFPAHGPYPADQLNAITDRAMLHGETDEGIGMAVRLLQALTTGDVGLLDEPGSTTWQFHTDILDLHRLTIGQVREYTAGLSLTEAAQLLADADDVPMQAANRSTVERTGGFVTAWLREGDYRESGGDVPPGKAGLRLLGGPELVDDPAELAEFGEAVATRWQSPMVQAVGELGDAIGAQFAVNNGDFAGALCCDVADAIAKTLAVSGHLDLAARFVAMHADADDDDGDRHAHIQRLPIDTTIPAAEQYVRGMLPTTD